MIAFNADRLPRAATPTYAELSSKPPGPTRHRPAVNAAHKKRQADLPAAVVEISTKAQHRLHQRFTKLTAKGKHAGKVVTAVARELLGFVWAIGVQVEKSTTAPTSRKAAA